MACDKVNCDEHNDQSCKFCVHSDKSGYDEPCDYCHERCAFEPADDPEEVLP